MARASGSSIPTASPTLHRALRRWLTRELIRLRPAILTTAATHHTDRYRKHFDTLTHTCLLLFHGLSGSPSLRQSYAAFGACDSLATPCGWSTTRAPVSYPQLAASNTSRPPEFLAGLLPPLLTRVRQTVPRADLPSDLHILDGTRIRLPQQLTPWATCHMGVGVQVHYHPALDLPAHVVVLQDEKTKDVQGMDQTILDHPDRLAALAGQTLVFDRGYHSHDRMLTLLAAGIHLVTRLHPQARVKHLADLPCQQALGELPAHRVQVLGDQRILLGSPNNRRTKRLLVLRLITATVAPLPRAARLGATTVTYQILTDHFDRDAIQVVQLYLYRWQIELFFRWLKRVVKLVRPLGTGSRAVVTLSVWLAILIHLLGVLAAHAIGLARRSPSLLFLLRTILCSLDPALLVDDDPPLIQLALIPPDTS
jgi:Transposase DDE domain